MDIALAAGVGGFVGGFAGVAVLQFVRAALGPLRNRSEHKRLLKRDAFQECWGRNVVSFFLLHGGFERGDD